ncbi:MAG: putative toxin-antitoxin system toxin component, PIN family [Acidimicrobiia bacterium]
MRAVLDPNVLISALLAPGGSPAKVLRAWLDGAYELVVSALLLMELERALGYPKLRDRVDNLEAAELVDLLGREAQMFDDPANAPAVRSPDPGDDYLIALASAAQAVIVSGDRHLLTLVEALPVYSPAQFLALLDDGA